MLKKIYISKNLEETLGIVGLCYLAVLGCIAFFLVRFLVGAMLDSLSPTAATRAPLPTFDPVVLASLQPATSSTATPQPSTTPAPEASTSTAVASSSASSSPTPVSPAAVSLQILNGTTKSGLATSWQERFTAAGFAHIVVGYTTVRDATGTTVIYRPSRGAAVPLVRDVLIAHGTATSIARPGEEGAPYDVTIIVNQ